MQTVRSLRAILTKGKIMTYYRVEFLAADTERRPVKRFRTEETSKKHARKVLGLLDHSELDSKVAIVAVSKDGTPV